MNPDIAEIIRTVTIVAVPLMLSVCLHELAHGWMAERFGDLTARRAGRITLNPLAHVDPIGTVILPVMLIAIQAPIILGWAKPVPVNVYNFAKLRKGIFWTSLAGPGTNLILAAVSALLHLLLLTAVIGLGDDQVTGLVEPVSLMLTYSVMINVVLMTFNLIPVLPLDGGRIFYTLLPDGLAEKYESLERYGVFIVLALVFLVPPTRDLYYWLVATIRDVFLLIAYAPLYAG